MGRSRHDEPGGGVQLEPARAVTASGRSTTTQRRHGASSRRWECPSRTPAAPTPSGTANVGSSTSITRLLVERLATSAGGASTHALTCPRCGSLGVGLSAEANSTGPARRLEVRHRRLGEVENRIKTPRTAGWNGCRSPASTPTPRRWRWSSPPATSSSGASSCCSPATSLSPNPARCATGCCTSPASSCTRSDRCGSAPRPLAVDRRPARRLPAPRRSYLTRSRATAGVTTSTSASRPPNRSSSRATTWHQWRRQPPAAHTKTSPPPLRQLEQEPPALPRRSRERSGLASGAVSTGTARGGSMDGIGQQALSSAAVGIEPRGHRHNLELDFATTISDAAITSPVIAGFFSGLLARQRSPWLIIVIRFNDDPADHRDNGPTARRSTYSRITACSSPKRAPAP